MSFKCSVLNCKNTSKDTKIKFHKLPKDEDLYKKWVKFCGQAVMKYAKVCSEHFREDDYEGSLKAEMGFARCRYLKKGAVPSIKKYLLPSFNTALEKPWPPQNSKISILPLSSTKAAEISHKTSGAEGQNKLSTAAKPVVKIAYILPKALNRTTDIKKADNAMVFTKPLCQTTTTPVIYASPTISLMPPPSCDLNSTIDYLENKVEMLKKDATARNKFLMKQIELLKAENQRLHQCSTMRLEEATGLKQQIVTLKQEKCQLESVVVQYLQEKTVLETRVKEAESEQRNLERKLQTMFTPKQIKMLKNGRRQNWNEEDIAISVKLYRTSPKMYIMLKKKNYPLPSVRVIQRWCQTKKNTIDGTEDDADKESPSSTVKNDTQIEERLVDESNSEAITNDMFDIEMIDENTEEEQNTAVEMLYDHYGASSDLHVEKHIAFKVFTYDSDETISAMENKNDIAKAILFDDANKANQNSIIKDETPGIEVQEFIIP